MKSRLTNGFDICDLELEAKGKSLVLQKVFKIQSNDRLVTYKTENVFKTTSLKEAIMGFYKVREKFFKQGYELEFHKNGKKIPSFKKSKVFLEDKSPLTKTNHVGVEIEFLSPLSKKQLSQMLCHEGLEKYVCLKSDISIENCYEGKLKEGSDEIPDKQYLFGHEGHELCIVASEREIHKVLPKLKKFFKLAQAKINDTCGVHIHLDMRNRDVHDGFKNLVDAQNWYFKINPERKNNQYCRLVEVNDFNKAKLKYKKRGFYQKHRFLAVNPHSFRKLKTLEVRVHKGTLNIKDISNWIKFLVQVVDGNTEGSTRTFNHLVERFNLTESVKKYIESTI